MIEYDTSFLAKNKLEKKITYQILLLLFLLKVQMQSKLMIQAESSK